MSKSRIPKPFPSKGVINRRVAQIENPNDGTQPYKISYKFYKDRHCEIEHLDSSSSKKCLKTLRDIGKSIDKNSLKNNNIQSKPVHNSGAYSSLFHQLTPDVRLFEIDLGKKSRLFYFTEQDQFHIVLIKHGHFET